MDSRPSVLIVEDDAMTREQLGELLGEHCRELHLAENGEQGLAAYRASAPDVVVTDLLMPVMNGAEMVRRIREADPEIPIVVMTAYSTVDNFGTPDGTFTRFVFKPVDADELVDAIGSMHAERNQARVKRC